MTCDVTRRVRPSFCYLKKYEFLNVSVIFSFRCEVLHSPFSPCVLWVYVIVGVWTGVSQVEKSPTSLTGNAISSSSYILHTQSFYIFKLLLISKQNFQPLLLVCLFSSFISWVCSPRPAVCLLCSAASVSWSCFCLVHPEPPSQSPLDLCSVIWLSYKPNSAAINITYYLPPARLYVAFGSTGLSRLLTSQSVV